MKRDINDVGPSGGDASMDETSGTGEEDAKRMRPMDPCRSLYIGGIDNSVRAYDLCKVASSFGALESAKIIYEKKCAFVNFVSLESAAGMHAAANAEVGTTEETTGGDDDDDEEQSHSRRKDGFFVGPRTVSVSWGKAKPIDEKYFAEIEAGASRCVFVTRIKVNSGDGCLSEEELAMTFASFGEVESVVVIANKGIAFVNFMSIRSAMKAMKVGEEDGIRPAGNRSSSKLVVKFAVDTGKKSSQNIYCPPPRGPPGSHGSMFSPRGGDRGRFQGEQPRFHPGERPPPSNGSYAGSQHRAPQYSAPPPPYRNEPYRNEQYGRPEYGGDPPPRGGRPDYGGRQPAPSIHQGSRSLYLSKVSEQTTYRDLCSLANMYGRLDSVRLNTPKHNAFFNFIDSAAANNLFNFATAQGGIMMHGENMRVGWAKSQPMRAEVVDQLKNDGLSRTLYLSGIPDGATEEHLREAFDSFSQGEYESVTVMPAKHIAFVNFTQMSVARAAKLHYENNPDEAKILGVPFMVKYGREKVPVHHDEGRKRPAQGQVPSYDSGRAPPSQYGSSSYPPPASQRPDRYGQQGHSEAYGQRPQMDSYGQQQNPYAHPQHPPQHQGSYPPPTPANPYESASQLGFPTYSGGNAPPASAPPSQPPGGGKFWITDGSGNYTEIDPQQLAAINSLRGAPPAGGAQQHLPPQQHQQIPQQHSHQHQAVQQQYMDY